MHYLNRYSILLLCSFCIIIVSSVGCKRHKPTPLSTSEIQEIVKGQPLIFNHNSDTNRIALELFENIYLGQNEHDAMQALNDYCPAIDVFEGGWRHQHAVFKGCIIDEGDHPLHFRVGFWPQADNRVSTLEIKRPHIAWDLVRARFTQLAPDLTFDRPRPGVLIMASDTYRLFADWDEGAKGPAHIIIGYTPEAIKKWQ